jgi:F-type H+-transporting ATPase subunit b
MRRLVMRTSPTKLPAMLPAALTAFAYAGSAMAETEHGLPQLNPAVFSPQLIWLLITFAALYFLMSKVALPGIEATLAARQGKIEGDLAAAERLKAEAETTLGAYQKTIAEARAKAQAELKQAAASIAAEAAKRESALVDEINARTKTAEAAIAAAKTAALADIRSMASEAARQLVTRLSGAEPAAAEISAAVAAAEREQH